MPRPIWSGAISFGLVNVPVKLFSATKSKTVSFNQIDSRSGSRIKYQKVSAADGTEVPGEAIVKGYDRQVVLAPYPGMKTRIALTAWTRLDAFDEYDEGRIVRFIRAYRGIDHHKR